MEKKGFITKDKLIKIAKINGIKATDRLLNWYKNLKLIEPSKRKRFPGIPGTVSFYKNDTLKLLYVIKNLKETGYRLKLREIRYYLDLLKLDNESTREIEKIKRENAEYRKDILFSIGITPEQKEYLLDNIPLKLLNCKKLITRLDIFKRVVGLRAFAELDQGEITKVITSDINSRPEINRQNMLDEIIKKGKLKSLEFKYSRSIDDILDNPKISINLKNATAPISAEYLDPVNRLVCFSNKGVKVY
ncbi:hypothetical protein ES708_25943 [subsurface metagenome]